MIAIWGLPKLWGHQKPWVFLLRITKQLISRRRGSGLWNDPAGDVRTACGDEAGAWCCACGVAKQQRWGVNSLRTNKTGDVING